MVWLGVPYFWEALRDGEMSSNAGGLIVWPIKFFILAGFVLLLTQALSEIIKRWAVLRGLHHDRADCPQSRADHVPSLIAFLLLGYPVAFSLAANGLLFFCHRG